MPHCQKENHDHRAKSKRDRLKKKEALARKKAARTVAEEEELEKQKLSNNIALADGFGEYEIGCEEEKEYIARFNMNKRSKKHLRIDIRRQAEKKEREEAERLKREQEEKYRLEREKLNQETAEAESSCEQEEELITEEYLVYICQCCHKKFNSKNHFINHTNSKKHKEYAKLYEEAGVIVTEVKLKAEFDDDDYSYEEESEEGQYFFDEESIGAGVENVDSGDEDESDEEEYVEEKRKVGNVFSAFAAFSDSSSSSSGDSSDEAEDADESNIEGENENRPPSSTSPKVEEDDGTSEYDDDLDLLEEIIYQNRLQERLYPDDDPKEEKEGSDEIVPVAFDEEQFNPDNFNADENRLASVQRRLQKRLADKGIQPNQINPGYRTSDAVSMGKTLLQQVMEANIETLEAKLEAYKRHKTEHQLLGREFKFAKGNSKALASQYIYRIDPADNARRRANVHHTGSHYHMQAARSMQFGRMKGMMARHSNQGARLQASRMAAKEFAQMHGKGMKIGKTSKKSLQKRCGQAGGSKKTGGMNTSEN